MFLPRVQRAPVLKPFFGAGESLVHTQQKLRVILNLGRQNVLTDRLSILK